MSPDRYVVGHVPLRHRLEKELAQAVLLLGPESVGKWLLATHLADEWAPWYDQLLLRTLSVADAQRARDFLQTPPRRFPLESYGFKVVAIDLDGAVSQAAQHALLKTLEEPPAYVKFLLTSSRPPLATIASRCETIRVGALTEDQVTEVLIRYGMSARDAAAAAPAGRGRVAPALAASVRMRPAKAAVLGVAKALATKDRELLERSAREWGPSEDWMLRELLGAAASGRPTTLFSSSERQLMGKTAARRVIALLAASGSARPAIALRAVASVIMAEGK